MANNGNEMASNLADLMVAYNDMIQDAWSERDLAIEEIERLRIMVTELAVENHKLRIELGQRSTVPGSEEEI